MFVMPGLVPGIHVLRYCRNKDVDGRDKPGHDEEKDDGLSRCGIKRQCPPPLFFIAASCSGLAVP
jgi:hypothetical protein